MTIARGGQGVASAQVQRGVALMIVLWTLVLLMTMVGSLLWQGRTDVRMALTLTRGAQARALAEGALFETLAALVAIAPPPAFDLGGTVFEVPVADGTVRVKVENEAGKIDLNAVHPVVFERVLTILGVPAREQRRLSDALQDFRDADGLVRPDGAEDADYLRAGLSHGAKDAPFAAIEELAQVLGFTPGLCEALRPALTVHGRRVTPDLRYAGSLLREALATPGAATAVPGVVTSVNAATQPPGAALLEAVPGRASIVTPAAGGQSAQRQESARAGLGTYTIRAEALAGDVAVGIDAIVSVSRRPGTPYTILTWHERAQGLVSTAP